MRVAKRSNCRGRTLPDYPRMPVIVLSSSANPEDRARVAQAGATQYFRKPTELDQCMKLGSLVEGIVQNGSFS